MEVCWLDWKVSVKVPLVKKAILSANERLGEGVIVDGGKEN